MTQPNGDTYGVVGHVRFISLEYDATKSTASALRLVTELRPEWKAPGSNVEFVRFKEGITNTLLKAISRRDGLSEEEIDNEAVLLRAYGHGTQVLIDRERETQNHELLMKHGLAPELLARFKNGMMYRFIRGQPTVPDDLRKQPIYLAVAKRLAQWHAMIPCLPSAVSNGPNGSGRQEFAVPGKPSPNVWTVMQKWVLALPTSTDAERQRQSQLQEELTRSIHDLSQRPGLGKNSLVFAHCDLLSGNVIVEPKGSTDGHGSQETVSFIDYEYATPSPAAFDLANHFAEWGGFDCDYNVLPTRAQRLDFIRAYIQSYFSFLPDSDKPSVLDEEAETQKLLEEVDVFRGIPGLYWGIWALIQAQISQIDFDYASYAEVRLGEYWAWKDEVSGARTAGGKELPLREKRWAQPE